MRAVNRLIGDVLASGVRFGGAGAAAPAMAGRAIGMPPYRLLLALLLLGCCGSRPPAFAECPVYVGAGNFTVDLEGGELPGDSEREDIFGARGSWVFPLKFAPPEGARVRIREIHADVQAWPTRRGAGPAVVPAGEYAGYLAAVGTNRASMGSSRADWMADDVFAYWQGQVDSAGGSGRESFSVDLRDVENNVLGEENTLFFTVAKYLDTTGIPRMHIEVTFVVKYAWDGCGKPVEVGRAVRGSVGR